MNRPISVPDHDTFSDRETANVRDHLDTLRGPFRITVHVEPVALSPPHLWPSKEKQGLELTFYMTCNGHFR
jgi:hypothetical protein